MTDQPKIKAGDLVRIVGGAYPEYGIPIGSVRRVHEVLYDGRKLHCVYIFDKDGCCLMFLANDVEFVAAAEDSLDFHRPSVEYKIADPQPVEVATLRDQFAMAATDEDVNFYRHMDFDGLCDLIPKYSPAQARYRFADAMLAARREGQG